MLRILSIFLLLCLAENGFAIVNIESMKSGKNNKGFSSQLGFSAAGASGNTDKLNLSVATRLNWQEDERTDFIVAEYQYGESKGTKDAEKAFIHARHIAKISDRRDWELFVQGSKNEFARLNFRGLVGLGLRFKLDKKEKFYFGIGGFYERESIQEELGTVDELSNNTWRMNNYLVYKDKLNEQIKFSNVLYVQPAFEDFSDLRVLGQFSFLVKAGKSVNIKLSVDLGHDQNPPQNVDKTDVQYSTGLVFEF